MTCTHSRSGSPPRRSPLTIVLGSLFLWIGVPVLGMWIAGQVTTSSVGFLFATLGGIPVR